MKLVYENKRGKIVMKGGGRAGFNITQIKGISLPENDVSTVRYPNMPGQTVTRSTPMERFITISADVRDENKKELSRAMGVFSAPGVLYITSCGKTKKISARCVSFEPNKSMGAYTPFTVQLCADNPYFEDLYETLTPITERRGVLSSPFVLGCKFSERILKNNVINRGDADVEPVFEITSSMGAECPYGICIKNTTNSDEIMLNTDVSPGEVITVDVKNRKVTSSTRGNIISCLSEFASLADFAFETGVSLCEISAAEISGELTAVCRHNNSYASAVV